MSEGKRVVRQYPVTFKVDAVRLLEEQGYTVSEAANSLGIPQANLTKWRKQYREGRLLPGHRRAQPTAEEAELRRLQSEVKRLEMELAIVKKAVVSSSGRKPVRYAFIKAHRGQWSVSLMAEVLAVSLSGFYSWLNRPQSQRAQDDEVLTEKITMFHCGSRCTYGAPRIHKDLKAAGHKVGCKRVARLMRSEGLRGKTKRKFKRTTISQHQRPKAENLVKQNFDAADPNALWASDITYISTAEGWLYLAVTLDLFSRKVVGWAFSDRLSDSLTLKALVMATQQRPTPANLLHHSDQGIQYASSEFRAALQANGICQSMSGKGNCYDNAVVESFFATLKIEEVENADYQTRQQARTSIFRYLEGFYNNKRRHSSLGYLSPDDFERVHFAKAA